MSKLLVFIPCYRCEKQIERVIQKFQLSGIEADLLLVDNRSPDLTVQSAITSIEKLKLNNTFVIQNLKNFNLGGSHKVAFNYALKNGYSHLIVLHGDDQADIRDVLPLLKNNLHLQYDCLLGSRFLASSQLMGYSTFRTLGNKVLNIFCNLVCKDNISDMGSGLNIYSRRFFSDTRYITFPDDLTFNVSLLFHGYLAGFKTIFFPISWREEDQVSNAQLFTQMKNIFRMIIQTLQEPSSLYHGSKKEYSYEVLYQK